MTLVRLSERISYLQHVEELDCPVLALVRGDRLALAVDAGYSPRHVADFYCELVSAGLPLPDLTALTHWHWDHGFGMGAVAGLTDEDITMPATPGNLNYVRDALQENRNYVTHDEWSAPTIENGVIVPNEYTNYDRKAYYTDKYVFFDTPGDEYYDALEIYYGEEISEEQRAPYGYVEKDGAVYK